MSNDNTSFPAHPTPSTATTTPNHIPMGDPISPAIPISYPISSPTSFHPISSPAPFRFSLATDEHHLRPNAAAVGNVRTIDTPDDSGDPPALGKSISLASLDDEAGSSTASKGKATMTFLAVEATAFQELGLSPQPNKETAPNSKIRERKNFSELAIQVNTLRSKFEQQTINSTAVLTNSIMAFDSSLPEKIHAFTKTALEQLVPPFVQRAVSQAGDYITPLRDSTLAAMPTIATIMTKLDTTNSVISSFSQRLTEMHTNVSGLSNHTSSLMRREEVVALIQAQNTESEHAMRTWVEQRVHQMKQEILGLQMTSSTPLTTHQSTPPVTFNGSSSPGPVTFTGSSSAQQMVYPFTFPATTGRATFPTTLNVTTHNAVTPSPLRNHTSASMGPPNNAALALHINRTAELDPRVTSMPLHIASPGDTVWPVKVITGYLSGATAKTAALVILETAGFLGPAQFLTNARYIAPRGTLFLEFRNRDHGSEFLARIAAKNIPVLAGLTAEWIKADANTAEPMMFTQGWSDGR